MFELHRVDISNCTTMADYAAALDRAKREICNSLSEVRNICGDNVRPHKAKFGYHTTVDGVEYNCYRI